MEHVQITERQHLERAIFIGAFAGWNDAASAASWSVKFLINQWDAQPFAELDPELFYDFSETRPTVRIAGGALRRLSWPANRFYVYHADKALANTSETETPALNGDEHSTDARPSHGMRRDVVLFLGDEPQLRWKTFAREIVELCRECHVEEMVLLGSLMAEAPHTLPTPISGVTSHSGMLRRMSMSGVERANYNGATGILTALQDTARKEGIATTSLWGAAPHYVSATPNLPVSEALLRKLDQLYDFNLNLNDLARAAKRFTSRVSSLVAEDPEVSAYVHELEQRTSSATATGLSDAPFRGDASGVHRIPMDGELPSPEEAVQDVEAWLRHFREESGTD